VNNTSKWVVGSVLVGVALMVVPFVSRFFLPYGRYEMMGYGYGWHIPMMYGRYGMASFGMLFMWLIPLALLVLIGSGIAWLVRALTAKNAVEDAKSII
jgi:hypothetical protein